MFPVLSYPDSGLHDLDEIWENVLGKISIYIIKICRS